MVSQTRKLTGSGFFWVVYLNREKLIVYPFHYHWPLNLNPISVSVKVPPDIGVLIGPSFAHGTALEGAIIFSGRGGVCLWGDQNFVGVVKGGDQFEGHLPLVP